MAGKSARRLLLVEKQVEDCDWMVNNKGAASVCLGGIIGHLCVHNSIFLQQFPLCMCMYSTYSTHTQTYSTPACTNSVKFQQHAYFHSKGKYNGTVS